MTQAQDAEAYADMLNNSLNTSNIETEGHIGPSPKKPKPNLFATGPKVPADAQKKYNNSVVAPSQAHFSSVGHGSNIVINNNNWIVNVNQTVQKKNATPTNMAQQQNKQLPARRKVGPESGIQGLPRHHTTRSQDEQQLAQQQKQHNDNLGFQNQLTNSHKHKQMMANFATQQQPSKPTKQETGSSADGQGDQARRPRLKGYHKISVSKVKAAPNAPAAFVSPQVQNRQVRINIQANQTHQTPTQGKAASKSPMNVINPNGIKFEKQKLNMTQLNARKSSAAGAKHPPAIRIKPQNVELISPHKGSQGHQNAFGSGTKSKIKIIKRANGVGKSFESQPSRVSHASDVSDRIRNSAQHQDNKLTNFTQNANIANPSKNNKKSNFNGVDDQELSKKYEQQRTTQRSRADEILRQTPNANEAQNQNQGQASQSLPSSNKITSFQSLFTLLGVPTFQEQDYSFTWNNQRYSLDVAELMREAESRGHNRIRIRTQKSMSNQASAAPGDEEAEDTFEFDHDQINHTASKTGALGQNGQNANRRQTKTPRLMGPGMINPVNDASDATSQDILRHNISRTAKSPNSQSQLNLIPPSTGILSLQKPNQPPPIIKGLDNIAVQESLKSMGNLKSPTNRSHANSVMNSKREQTSQIVKSHEQKANRLRSRSRSKMSPNPSAGGTLNSGNMNTQTLTMQRQNMTENIGNFTNSNQFQLGANSRDKGNLSQRQLQQMQRQQYRLGHDSGSGTAGTYSSLQISNKTPQQQFGLPQNLIPQQQRQFNNDVSDGGMHLMPQKAQWGTQTPGLLSPQHASSGGGMMMGQYPSIGLQESEVQQQYQNRLQPDHDQKSEVPSQIGHDTIANNDQSLFTRRNIHLAFLFASPLLLKTSEQQYYDVLPPISFSEEFEHIRENMEAKEKEFIYRYSVATSKNLQTALRENPLGLHFSGHGFLNTETLYRQDKKGWMKNKKKGDVLIFEDEAGTGASDFFFTSDLQKMIQEVKDEKLRRQKSLKVSHQTPMGLTAQEVSNENGPASRRNTAKPNDDDAEENLEDTSNSIGLQFVFVASCHSEEVGKIFKEAGIPHVICINKKETVLDKAAIEFSKFFYDELFDSYKNICEAYRYAKAKVEKTFGKFQAEKIMLLTNEKTHGEVCPELWDDRLRRERGPVECINLQTELRFLPNKVTPFVSRNQDMFETLRLLTENNIVQIYGMPGLGKSSLLKNATCFLGERDIYKDGVVYIDFLHVTTFRDAIQIINAYLKDVGGDDYPPSYDSDPDQDECQAEVESLRFKLGTLKKKFLLSMDNLHHLQRENHEKFLKFINEIASRQFKVLFTSDMFDMKCFGDGFMVKKIQKLKREYAVDLFIKKIPLGEQDKKQFLEYGNIKDLHKVTQAKYANDKDLVPPLCTMKHAHNENCTKTYLTNHPLIEFLGGVPLVISMMAPLSVQKSLGEIFLYFAGSGDGNFQSELLKGKLDDQSLIMSLECCTSHFENKENGKIRDLWYMIGLQGPGILYDDLKTIYCFDNEINVDENHGQLGLIEDSKEEAKQEEANALVSNEQLDEFLEELKTFSVIEQENLDHKQKRFRVSPFVDTYIQRKTKRDMRKNYLETVCTLLNAKMVEFKQEYAQKILSCKKVDDATQILEKLQEKARPYESQIMHVVQQLFAINEEIVADAQNAEDKDGEHEDALQDDMNADQDLRDEKPKMLKAQDSATSQKKAQGKVHSRKKSASRDIPKVSEFLKYGRSTFAMKSQNNKQQLATQADASRQGEMYSSFNTLTKTAQNLKLMKRTETNVDEKSSDMAKATSLKMKQKMRSETNAEQTEQLQRNQTGSNPASKSLDGKDEDHEENLNIFQQVSEESREKLETFMLDFKDHMEEPGGRAGGIEEIEEKSEPEEDSSFGSDESLKEEGDELTQKDYNQFAFLKARDDEYQSQPSLEDAINPQDIKETRPDFDRNLEEDKEINQFDNIEIKEDQIPSLALNVPREPAIEVEPELLSQRSNGSVGGFEKNVSPFELAKMINPHWKDCGLADCADIAHLAYNFDSSFNNRLSVTQKPPKSFLEQNLRRRQTKMLQKLDAVKFDDEKCRIQRNLRQSILDKSLSRNKKSTFNFVHQLIGIPQCNPDLQECCISIGDEDQPQEMGYTQEQLAKDSHEVDQAPRAKSDALKDNVGLKKINSSQPIQIQLAIHEELFFHYLSILALIPDRRSDLLSIITETYGQKDRNSAQNARGRRPTDMSFDMVQEAEKRLKKFKTVVEIPDEAKLLIANCMMVELYATIQEEVQSNPVSIRQKNQNRAFKYDIIYEKADEMRPFFQEIQFKRGMAMLDYVQSRRHFHKFRNYQEFKKHLKEAANGFRESHEIEGIQQCLEKARQYQQWQNKQKPLNFRQNQEKINPNQSKPDGQQFVDEIEEILNSLKNNQDSKIQGFVNFRKQIKINGLSTRVVDRASMPQTLQQQTSFISTAQQTSSTQKQGSGETSEPQAQIVIDLVYNMLLNPQHFLTLNKNERKI